MNKKTFGVIAISFIIIFTINVVCATENLDSNELCESTENIKITSTINEISQINVEKSVISEISDEELVVGDSYSEIIGDDGSEELFANFSKVEVSNDGLLVVQFNDTSKGNPISWNWNFNNEELHTQQNTTFNFNSFGLYNITLTVNNGTDSSSITKSYVVDYYYGELIKNPNFDNATRVGRTYSYDGWTIVSGSPALDVVTNQYDGNTVCFLVGNAMSQLIDFKRVDSISFYARNRASGSVATLNISIDDEVILSQKLNDQFEKILINIPKKFKNGEHDFKITCLDNRALVDYFEAVGDYPIYYRISDYNPSDYIIDSVEFNNTVTISPWDGSLTVQFTDLSEGNITSWSWDFGDGVISKSQNPTHVYSTAGQFDVTLTVSNLVNNLSITKSKLITVYHSEPYTIIDSSFENTTDGWTLSEGASIAFNESARTGEKLYNDGQYSIFLSEDPAYIEKEINFDDVDFIQVDATANPNSGGEEGFSISIDGNAITKHLHARKWTTITYDTSDLEGNHTVRLGAWSNGYNIYVDSFRLGKNAKYLADFNISSIEMTDEGFVVALNDKSYGNSLTYLWNFGDGTTSTLRNPIHTFKSGEYPITLTISSNGLAVDKIVKRLSFVLPSINGTSYNTIQDAINNANESDVIDIAPLSGGVFSENLLINKSLTLNFNGAIINAKDASLPLINVTDGATVTVNNIGLNKASAFVTDGDSKLIIKDSDIGVDLDLSEGNVELLEDSFNNSLLTLVANTNITGSTVTKGGVIINGGKSKIFNTTLTGCDVAVTQTAGELELISNLITGNNVGVNVTGGKTNMEYNVIYANTGFGLVYVDDVTFENNWWGVKDLSTSYESGENLPDTSLAIFRLGDGVDIPSFLILSVNPTTSVMGANKEYEIPVDVTSDEGVEIVGYIPTFTLDFTSDGGDVIGETIIENGKGQVILTTTDKELSDVNITTLGENYPVGNIVVNTEINITYDEDNLVPGEKLIVNVEIPYATGNVTIIVNGDKNTTELVDNAATYTIDELVVGSYNVIVFYEGNDIFGSAYETKSFDVVKSTADLIYELNETIRNQTEKIGNLTDERDVALANASALKDERDVANGKVENLTGELDDAQANASQLAKDLADANGKVDNLTADLDARDSVIDNLTGQVDNLTDVVNVQNSTIANQAEQISALNNTVAEKEGVIASKDAEISNLNDTVNTQSSTIDSQKALINNLNETIIEQNNKASNPIATTILADNITTTATTAKYFTISLMDANNNPLVNKTIMFTVNGKTDSVTTNGSGIATVEVTYNTAGTRYYTFSFLGDNKYSASIAAAKVVVNKKATKITAPKKTFKVKTKTKKVQVKLKSGKTVLKSKKVTLKVKGKTYTAKTNKKGIATFKITKLTKKGTFKYVVKFAGDKAYKAIKKNGKIIVK